MSLTQRAGGVLVAGPAPQELWQPINYIYSHLHDSIRLELDNLGQAVLLLQQAGNGGAGLGGDLAALQDRYRFLEQVYKYHSSVEDEVRVGLRASLILPSLQCSTLSAKPRHGAAAAAAASPPIASDVSGTRPAHA
jgi:hypothetical protein